MSTEIKPTMRGEASTDIGRILNETTNELNKALRKHIVKCDGDSILRSCLNCIDFNEPKELCKRYNARPPARVIAYGCPSYTDNNDIPF